MGGSRSTWREPTHTRGEHANSTQKGPRWGLNLEPSRCEAMVLTTTPPCSPFLQHIRLYILRFIDFHPSIFYTRLICQSGREGAGAYPSGRFIDLIFLFTIKHYCHKVCKVGTRSNFPFISLQTSDCTPCVQCGASTFTDR